MLKILVCGIVPGFCKSGHILQGGKVSQVFQAFKTDLRSMAKSSNRVKPNLSLHNTSVTLSLAPY